MRAVIQRVARAAVTPGGSVGAGLCVLLGISAADDEAAADRLAGKVARMRIFEGEHGRRPRHDHPVIGVVLLLSEHHISAVLEWARGAHFL